MSTTYHAAKAADNYYVVLIMSSWTVQLARQHVTLVKAAQQPM